MRAQLAIRAAMINDALILSQLAERCFRDAFAADNSPQDMDEHCLAAYGEAIQTVEILDPQLLTLLAWQNASLAGYAQCRVSPPPCSCGHQRSAELQRLYVDQSWHGTGVAQGLMAAVVAQAATWGCDGLWLGVWEHNHQARAFYHKHGFVVVGEKPFLLGQDLQQDLVMARTIDDSVSAN